MSPRELPSVHELVESLSDRTNGFPRSLVVDAARRAIAAARSSLPAPVDLRERVLSELAGLERPSLRRVINATGVVLHTNLGRAPLGEWSPIGGYSNLEYDVAGGRRGKRDMHASGLLERLLGAPAIVVNNNAAAIFLALHELAAGQEVIVSRGELIEIGDGFRIPEIMARSGAILREVGTTNRTSIEDYREAINDRTRLLLRVHPSNFKITGFTARPALKELTSLGVPVYEDLGSGCVTDLRAFGVDEPLVSNTLADLVSFSGDKLLGGPQAGILAGRAELISRLRRNPMYRALRADKLIYQALENTLRNLLLERWDQIPALRMIRLSADEIRTRAEALTQGLHAEVIPGESVIGGGATPEQPIPTWLIALNVDDPTAMEKKLRSGEPPVIARIENDRLLLDLRTVFPAEEAELRSALYALSR